MQSKSYRPKQAADFLGIGAATIWRWCKEKPDFPKPIRLSTRCTVFLSDELVAWRDAQLGLIPPGLVVRKSSRVKPLPSVASPPAKLQRRAVKTREVAA